MKLHKSLSLYLFFIVLSLTSFGQEQNDKKFVFGLGSSLDLSSYGLVDDRGPFTYRGDLGFSGGLIGRYSLNSKLWVGSKIYYSVKSYQEVLDYKKFAALNPNDPIYVGANEAYSKYGNSFLEIPAEAGYLVKDGNTRFYSTFALVNSFQLSNSDRYGSYNSYLLSAKLGFGFLFPLNKLGIYIEPQTRFFLNNVQGQDRKMNPIQFSIELQLLKLK